MNSFAVRCGAAILGERQKAFKPVCQLSLISLVFPEFQSTRSSIWKSEARTPIRLRSGQAGRTPKARQSPDQTEEASPWILHEVLSECGASSHRFLDSKVERSPRRLLNSESVREPGALVSMDAAFARAGVSDPSYSYSPNHRFF